MRSRAGLAITKISVFATKISVTRMKILPYEHSSLGQNFLHQIASLLQHSSQNGIIFALYSIFPFRSMQISFISKVMRATRMIQVKNLLWAPVQVYVPPISSGSTRLKFPTAQTTKFVQVTRLAQLPGSCGEALKSNYVYKKCFKFIPDIPLWVKNVSRHAHKTGLGTS